MQPIDIRSIVVVSLLKWLISESELNVFFMSNRIIVVYETSTQDENRASVAYVDIMPVRYSGDILYLQILIKNILLCL